MKFSVHMQTRALRIAALVFMIGAATRAFAQTAPFDPNQAASQLYNGVSGKFGTQDGIRQNAVNPLSTSGSLMTSISGTTTFNAPLVFCPASKKFLDVTLLPGNAGDISNIYVQQDTDFDGIFDYTYSVPVPVSGVCANGVISCDAGTWQNCKYYKWVADSSGKVSLSQGTMQDLGGCFCVNNSCGNNLVIMEISYVLSSLGGGVAGAIQAANPKWAVSNVTTTDTTISYYGQRADQCTTYTAGASGPSNPEQYYGQPAGGLEAAAQTEQAKQMAISTGYYYHLTSSLAAQTSPSQYQTCTIQDVAVVSTDRQVPAPNVSYTFYSSTEDWSLVYLDGNLIINTQPYWNGGWGGTFTYSQNIIPGNHTIYIVSGRGSQGMGMRFALQNMGDHTFPLVSTTGYFSNVCWDMGIQGRHGVPSGWPEGTAHSIWGCNNTVTATFNVPLVCPDGYTLNSIDFMCYKDTLGDSVVDNCSSLENNQDCKLQKEIVDGVVTYNNFNPTGLLPVPSCKTFSGAVQAFNVCHDWWTKNRTYLCQTSTAYDLSAIKERAKNISNTVTAGSSSFSYQDKTMDASGGWSYSSNTVDANTTGGASTCVTACKTRKPTTNTQASLTGTTAQSNVSTNSWEFFYKACPGDTCPIGPGEEVLIGCQCISEFAEAATIMETITQAGKDLICSNGTRQ